MTTALRMILDCTEELAQALGDRLARAASDRIVRVWLAPAGRRDDGPASRHR